MYIFNTISKEGKEEILDVIIERLRNDYKSSDTIDDICELHNECFNEDYFLIGYWKCEQWLKNNTQGIFSTIALIKDYENDIFGEGESNTDFANAENVLNMLIYIIGEEILFNLKSNIVSEMLTEISEICQ